MLKDLCSASMAAIDLLDKVIWKSFVVVEAALVSAVNVIVRLRERILLVHRAVHWTDPIQEGVVQDLLGH